MTTAIIDLRGRSDWNPAQLAGAALRWPTWRPLVELGDVVEPVHPDSTARKGTPVITLSSLDRDRGGVRRRTRTYHGRVFSTNRFGSGLRLGDLLVPPSAEQPVLLVSEALLGAMVSA